LTGPRAEPPVEVVGEVVTGPPEGVRTTPLLSTDVTRVVLVRHGEANCNVNGIVGGPRGCTGLTAQGTGQVEALAERLATRGELRGVGALYASVLPRAVATARILAPALDRWRDGPPLTIVERDDLSELHPGEADGLTWSTFSQRFGDPRWEEDPSRAIAPGGESWAGFTERAAAAVAAVAEQHRGELVVVACHAGVIEATMLEFLPIDRHRTFRGWLRTDHASMTQWELDGERWLLRRYNDVTPVGAAPEPPVTFGR
jgi:2,3-bisphosphoglycerate-dependent phosphoglycerate mutase